MTTPSTAGAGFLKLSSPATKDYWEIPVLYQDDHLIALEKPAGLLTSPDRYDPERPNLMRLLHTHIGRGIPWARERGLKYVANAHRLDFDTSGVILMARSKEVLTQLANLFGSEKPAKTYLALVGGTPEKDEFEVDARLAPHPARPGVMRVDPKHGKSSRTGFRILERFVGYTWMECRPFTGRTHQIRAHLWWVKRPIVGDRVYGGKPLWLSEIKMDFRPRKDRPEQPLMGRVALHAASLELEHPVTGTPLRIESPVPKDLQVALKYLRRYAAGVGGSGWGSEPLGPASSAPGHRDAHLDSDFDSGPDPDSASSSMGA